MSCAFVAFRSLDEIGRQSHGFGREENERNSAQNWYQHLLSARCMLVDLRNEIGWSSKYGREERRSLQPTRRADDEPVFRMYIEYHEFLAFNRLIVFCFFISNSDQSICQSKEEAD